MTSAAGNWFCKSGTFAGGHNCVLGPPRGNGHEFENDFTRRSFHARQYRRIRADRYDSGREFAGRRPCWLPDHDRRQHEHWERNENRKSRHDDRKFDAFAARCQYGGRRYRRLGGQDGRRGFARRYHEEVKLSERSRTGSRQRTRPLHICDRRPQANGRDSFSRTKQKGPP
jgi:hypothetical protein